MERERPDYLQPIPRTRWEFPWLGMWAVILLGMAGAGVWLHFRTGDAWTARFTRTTEAPPLAVPNAAATPARTPANEAEKQAKIAEIRRLREELDRASMVTPPNSEIRCIGGVVFRRIPGGWENLPDQTCP